MKVITREYLGMDTSGSCTPLPGDGPREETSERELGVDLTEEERAAILLWNREYPLPSRVAEAADKVREALGWTHPQIDFKPQIAARLWNMVQPPERSGGFWNYGFEE